MALPDFHRILKVDYLMLLLIITLAFYLAFIPHQFFPYQMHFDEWTHLALSNEIVKEAKVMDLTNPFTGKWVVGNQLFEVGFHLFWAIFHQISGIPWLTIFKYFPSIIFMITVISVYVLSRRHGFGCEAAFFTCLIPTTVGILGPGFMVPVAMGLFFITLALFVALNFRTGWSYIVLFVFFSFLLTLHAATAVGLITILIPYIILNARNNYRHSLGIALAFALPFLLALPLLPWLFEMLLLPSAKSLLTPQFVAEYVEIPKMIKTYGYLPTLFCLLGTCFLGLKGGRENFGLIFGLLITVVLVATFYTLHYGIDMMYYRGLIYAMLLMSIVAGVGLNGIRNLKLPIKLSDRLRKPFITKNVGNMLCLLLVGLTLVIAIPAHQSTPYYQMIDREDYEAFVWIKENIANDYDRAILDPWKGTAFTAITEKKVYTRIGGTPEPDCEKAYSFLQGGSKDTSFLRQNDISIVYTREPVDNLDLLKVRENVYLIKEPNHIEVEE
jgi:hypothetical protein